MINSPLEKYVLKTSSNRSPNIFTLVQKVKIEHTKRFNFKDKSRCRLFHIKVTFTYCADAVRAKVPSFQKVTQFTEIKDILQISYSFEFLLFEGFNDCRDYRRMRIQSFDTIGFLVSVTQSHEDKHYQQLKQSNSALSMHLRYKL